MPVDFYAQEIAAMRNIISLFGEFPRPLFLRGRMEMMRLESLRLLRLFFLPKICKVRCHGIGRGDQWTPSQTVQL